MCGFPAHKTLQALIQAGAIKANLLDQIQQLTTQAKKQGITVKNPETLLREIEPKIEPREYVQASLDIFEITLEEWLTGRGPRNRRVFIGGNYNNIALLRHIQDIVEDIDDFKAVIAIDFPEDYPRNMIYHVSMRILENCEHAIFEVSFSNGHLMEIERAKQLSKHTILLWQKRSTELAPLVTSMLMSDGFEKKGYRNFTELVTSISSFLSRI